MIHLGLKLKKLVEKILKIDKKMAQSLEILLRNRFPYYHWTGFWYVDSKEDNDVTKIGGVRMILQSITQVHKHNKSQAT